MGNEWAEKKIDLTEKQKRSEKNKQKPQEYP